MLKRILLALTFVAAFSVVGVGVTEEAEAWRRWGRWGRSAARSYYSPRRSYYYNNYVPYRGYYRSYYRPRYNYPSYSYYNYPSYYYGPGDGLYFSVGF